MRKIEATIPLEYSGRPLLHFLKGSLKFSEHIVGTLRHTENSVLLNDKNARVIDRVFEFDRLTVYLPEKTTPPLLCEMKLNIIYEDDDLLVLNKPAGVSVHPTRNHPNGTLANGVADYIIKAGGAPSAVRAVGRLDKGTSGVIVFAKNIYAASRLNGKIEKIYIAIAYKNMTGSGTIATPIYRPDPKKTLRATSENAVGESAVTHWEALRSFENETLLKIITETGRTHQIRVHLSSVNAPLVGDDMYGGPLTENMRRPALHCETVAFSHPTENKTISFFAPLPDDMSAELDSVSTVLD